MIADSVSRRNAIVECVGVVALVSHKCQSVKAIKQALGLVDGRNFVASQK